MPEEDTRHRLTAQISEESLRSSTREPAALPPRKPFKRAERKRAARPRTRSKGSEALGEREREKQMRGERERRRCAHAFSTTALRKHKQKPEQHGGRKRRRRRQQPREQGPAKGGRRRQGVGSEARRVPFAPLLPLQPSHAPKGQVATLRGSEKERGNSLSDSPAYPPLKRAVRSAKRSETQPLRRRQQQQQPGAAVAGAHASPWQRYRTPPRGAHTRGRKERGSLALMPLPRTATSYGLGIAGPKRERERDA